MSSSFDWGMLSFPPFYTLQPIPATMQRQLLLWSDVLFSHAIATCTRTITRSLTTSTCPVARLYTPSSSIFSSLTAKRTLTPDAAIEVLSAMADKSPQFCTFLSRSQVYGDGDDEVLLVCPVAGGFQALGQNLIWWVLHKSESATTESELQTKSVIMTFSELAKGNALLGESAGAAADTPTAGLFMDADIGRAPTWFVEDKSGSMTTEEGLRAIVYHLATDPDIVLTHRITLASLEGGSMFDGVRFGGRTQSVWRQTGCANCGTPPTSLLVYVCRSLQFYKFKNKILQRFSVIFSC